MTRIGEAFQAYVEVKTYYPARAVFDRANAPLLSWRVELLPYLGYKELYNQFRLEEPWNSRHNKALLTKIPAVYQSPERFDARTNYLVPKGVRTTFGRGIPAWPSTFEDGVHNTVFVVEADDALAVPWTQPSDYELDMAAPVRQLGALRGDWFYVVWGSGEVGRIPTSASMQHLKAMYTYDGGEDFFAGKIDQPLFPASLTASSTSPSGSAADSRATSITNSAADSLAPLAATYLERAASELARGADLEAGQWFYASALAGPPGRAWVERYQWIPALRRPSPRLRFGIGLQYSGPRKNRLEQEIASRIASGKAGGGSTWSTVTGQIGKSLVQIIAAHVEQCGGHALADPPPVQPGRRVATRPVRAARGPSLLMNSVHGEPLAPGVLFLALAEEPVLRTMASREGIDVLVLVEWQDVGHKQSVRVELFDTARDVSILQLPWVDSEAVAGALANPLASNPFPARLRQLAEFLEEQLLMQPLPEQIQPRHVAGRMAALAAQKSSNPLAALAEMRYYRERGLADDAQLLLGYQALIGQQPGSELFLGDAETRARVLKPWLPAVPPTASAPVRTATADDD
jgi:hypothetical protein